MMMRMRTLDASPCAVTLTKKWMEAKNRQGVDSSWLEGQTTAGSSHNLLTNLLSPYMLLKKAHNTSRHTETGASNQVSTY